MKIGLDSGDPELPLFNVLATDLVHEHLTESKYAFRSLDQMLQRV